MVKTSKQTLVIITTIFALLLISTVSTTLIPNAYATTINYQDEATSILGNVVGLNMNSYTQKLVSDSNNSLQSIPLPPTTLPSTSMASASASSFPRDDVIFNLTSAQSNLRSRCTFINGRLNQISIDNEVGSPSVIQPTSNLLTMTQGFLQRYQSYTGNSLYGSLSSMLSSVTLQTNQTLRTGNAMLRASIFGNQTENDFVWTYVDNNGNPAPMKDIVLSYRNGFLESFLDNWQLYQTIGAPTLSNQNAVATALQAVKNFSYVAQNADGTNFTVSDFKVATTFNVTLSYMNYDVQTPLQSTRGTNSYALYPAWYVGVGFDKVYPDGVTGLRIWVWADTGNISSVEPIVIKDLSAFSNQTVSSSSEATQTESIQVPSLLIFSLIAGLGLSGLIAVHFYGNKSKIAGFKRLWKMTASKRKVAALCLIVLPITVLVAVPIVKASSLKSEIYASSWKPDSYYESDPWIPALQNYYLENEFLYASQIADYIQMLYSQYEGVDSSNHAANNGAETYKPYILDYYIPSDETYYASAAVFHFGPSGSPTVYDDSYGNGIYASEISGATSGYQAIDFVMMWSCNTAGYWDPIYDGNGNLVGYDFYWSRAFANAWTQTTLGFNGFDMPDSSGHSFIGFLGESPSISFESFNGWSQVAGYWIEWFYYYAVYAHDSVHDALNDASYAVFGVPYESSPLPWYGTYWPGSSVPGIYHDETNAMLGEMEIYGDSNIYIYQ